MSNAAEQATGLKRYVPLFAVGGLLFLESVLFASAYCGWFEFNHHKGWTPLIAVLVAFTWLLLLLGWIGSSHLLKRPIQFGLAPLLVLVFVAALPCRWMAIEIHRARSQAMLVQLIRRDGGDAYSAANTRTPVLSSSLIELLGWDYFYDVNRVDVKNTASIQGLPTLPHLQHVNLARIQITDEELRTLTLCPELTLLNLADAQITDTVLMDVWSIKNLRHLIINETAVTGEGPKELDRLISDGARWRVGHRWPEINVLKLGRSG